jgi:uncharacterized membrane protein
LLGVPVIVVPLAILIAAIGVSESLMRRGESHEPFDRSPRAEDRIDELVREEFVAGEGYAEASIADAITQFESRWSQRVEQPTRDAASGRAAVEELRDSLALSATDTTSALRRVSDVCTRVTDGIAAYRTERSALVEAIARLEVREISLGVDDNRLTNPAPAATPRQTWPDHRRKWTGTLPSIDRLQPAQSISRLQQRARSAARRTWERGRPVDPAVDALRMRFAQGEIDADEYAARMAQLSDSH